MKKVAALVKGDLKNISRDFILLFSMLGPVIMAAALRLFLPAARKVLLENLGFDLAEYYTFIAGYLLFFTPVLVGILTGFIILDERDEDILTYFSVTPLTLSGYFLYRTICPLAVSFVFTFVSLSLSGLVGAANPALLPVVCMSSLEAPMMALFLGAFAGNKIEGLAYSKGIGVIMFGPVIGQFVNSNWQLLAGILPPYWVSKAFMSAYTGDTGYWLYICGGLLIHLLYIYLLFKKFRKRSS